MQIALKTPLSEILRNGQSCDKCGHCCSHGSGFLVEDDIKHISSFLRISEQELKEKFLEEKELFNTKRLRPKLDSKKPYGPCIFLKDNRSSKHEVKPLQCRIGTCKGSGEEQGIWFSLNYLVNKDDPESVRQYSLYLKSGGKTIPGGRLEELVPDKEKLDKMLNFQMLR